MTDLFRAAAEVGPHHILKMYNITGNTVNISPQLEANSVDSHYRLEVVTSDVKSERSHFSFMLVRFFENCGVFLSTSRCEDATRAGQHGIQVSGAMRISLKLRVSESLTAAFCVPL